MKENTRKILHSKKSDEWSTPNELFQKLNAFYGFTLDPCATPETAKCFKFFTQEDDGLAQSWANQRAFVNPPYSDIRGWSHKVAQELESGSCETVFLIPSRTDTKIFQELLFKKATFACVIKGRLKFEQPGAGTNSAPFPSVIFSFRAQIKEDELKKELDFLTTLGHTIFLNPKKEKDFFNG